MRKLLFLGLVRIDLAFFVNENPNDTWDSFMCRANKWLWPDYDGETLLNLLGKK